MAYRSILVHAGEAATAQWRYELAARIAVAEGARLTGIACSGLTELIAACGAALALAPPAAQEFAFLTESADAERLAFLSCAQGTGATSADARVDARSPANALPLAARYCDLLVIGQSETPASLTGGKHTLARGLLLHAPCPVLLVPPGPNVGALPRRVLLAWDGGMAASRAVRAAMPLLQGASTVAAVCFPPQQYLAAGDDEGKGTALQAYLACHGVAIELVTPGPVNDIGAALLALAEEMAIDLVVMGSFGHSRLREIVLGGVTETMLAEATMPLLMAS